jgi:hypothetical protein
MNFLGIETLTDLAGIAGIDYRRLMRAIDGESFITRDGVDLLVTALNLSSIWDLGARLKQDVLTTRSDVSGPQIPEGVAHRERLQSALDIDLLGNPEASVHITRDVLSMLHPDDSRSFFVATAKLISFFGNCGCYDDALEDFDLARQRAAAGGRKLLESDEYLWCELHAAVIWRRKSNLDRAEEILLRLSRLTQHRWGALHQLAVIAIVRARKSGDHKQRMELLVEAERILTRCLKAWKKTNDFRQAYSLRRLADVHFMMAELRNPDEHMTIAHDLLVEALMIFTERNLIRYRDATKMSLHVLFVIKGKKLANVEPMVQDPKVRLSVAAVTDVLGGAATRGAGLSKAGAHAAPATNGQQRVGAGRHPEARPPLPPRTRKFGAKKLGGKQARRKKAGPKQKAAGRAKHAKHAERAKGRP